MTLINLNGLQFNYEVSGSGEPLILIGGLTANAREWSGVSPYLEAHFTVYRPENRGSGQTTGWAPPFLIEDMADDVAKLISRLGLERPSVVGHSMGGAILQKLCIEHPKRVKAAVIVSSFAHFPKAAQLYLENTSALFASGIKAELVLRTIYTRLYGSEFLSEESNILAELNRMLSDPFPQTATGYQAQVKAIAAFDTRHDLKKILCPTVIINGSEDVLTPSYLSEALHRGIAHSKLAFIPDCGHMIPAEKPEQLARAVLDFFSD